MGDAARRVLTGVQKERRPPGLQGRIPTSLENMDPASPFVRYLAALPIDSRIHTHSIIPIRKAVSTDGAHDGVVTYASAHLDGVESEVLVPAGHSCQSHPRTTIELRRILREHIRLLDGTPSEGRGGRRSDQPATGPSAGPARLELHAGRQLRVASPARFPCASPGTQSEARSSRTRDSQFVLEPRTPSSARQGAVPGDCPILTLGRSQESRVRENRQHGFTGSLALTSRRTLRGRK